MNNKTKKVNNKKIDDSIKRGFKKLKKKETALMAEYKDFAFKGNIVDMATGVIIGGAFSKIVTSIVSDMITPLFSNLTGNMDLKSRFFPILKHGQTLAVNTIEGAKAQGIATINYGLFLSNVIDFLIVSVCIFLFIRYINKMRTSMKKEEEIKEVATTKECPFCFTQISINATRCPNCTSTLSLEKINIDDIVE